MYANSSDPAVLRCRVICRHYGQHLPALGIILTEHGLHKEVRSVNITNKRLYNITYEHIQSCDLSNNIELMEFQYSFYSLNVSMHKTVLTCGVIHPLSQPPCWAQSYAVIRYYEPMIPCMTTTNLTTTITATTVAVSGTGGGGGNGQSESYIDDLVTVFSPITAILVLALVVVISIAVIEGVFIAVRHRSPPNDIIPQNLHTPGERNLTPPKEFTHA